MPTSDSSSIDMSSDVTDDDSDESSSSEEESKPMRRTRMARPTVMKPPSSGWCRGCTLVVACAFGMLLLVGVVGFYELDSEIIDLQGQITRFHDGVASSSSSTSSTPVSPPPDKLNVFDHEEALKSIKDARQLLIDYYGKEEIVYDLMVSNPNRQKELYDKSTQYLANKFARAFVHGGKFVIGVMGSSVAAGHDNCNYDSYEKQLERFLQPVLKTANVNFEVRNAGEGGGCGDSMHNQVWCVRHTLGDDIDIAHYVWTYFENGAGLAETHEKFIRWSLLMKRAPAPQFVNVGGAENEWAKPLDAPYAKFGMQYVTVKPTLQKYYDWKFKWGQVGFGKHTTTRYGEKETDVDRKNSLGVAYRNWHPGPLGFQVVSDAFAFQYLDAMIMALDMIAAEKNTDGTIDLTSMWPQQPEILLSKDLPSPVRCDPSECLVEEPPGCWNMEKPTYGRSQIFELPLTDSLNSLKDKYDAKAKGWTSWTAGPNVDMVPRENRQGPTKAMCQHLDQCGAYESVGAASGWVSFRLPRATVGRILVCCYGKNCADAMIANCEFLLEHATLTPTKYMDGKCAAVQDKWSDSLTSDKGHLHLGVFAKEPQRITHVMIQ